MAKKTKTTKPARDPYEPYIEYLDLGPWPVFMAFTTCPWALSMELGRLGLDESMDFHARPGAHMTTHYFEGSTPLVIIAADAAPDMKKEQTRPGVVSAEQYCALLAHEAVHVAQYIKQELSPEHALGNESEAYLVQHIVMFCMDVAFDTGRSKSSVPRAAD